MRTIILFILLLTAFCGHAQRRKQIKVLIEQISANRALTELVEKGYRVAQNGLETIGDIKGEDLKLHLDHFDSLLKVNPRLKNWSRVNAIIRYVLCIIHDSKEGIQEVKIAGQFTNEELRYCETVFDQLMLECMNELNDLTRLLTDDAWSLHDDERMNKIDGLYIAMQDRFSFASSFISDMGILSLQRLSTTSELLLSEQLR